MSENLIGTWLRVKARIVRVDSAPPYRLEIWDPDLWQWVTVGGAGGGGTPLLRPGGLQHAVELVVLPGDPPDPVTVGGDFVYLRRMQPDFTLSSTGDFTIVQGA